MKKQWIEDEIFEISDEKSDKIFELFNKITS